MLQKRVGEGTRRVTKLQSQGIQKKSARVYQKASFPDQIKLALTGADPVRVGLAKAADRVVGAGIRGANSFADKHLRKSPTLRKIVKGAAKGLGVASAGARLASRVFNPLFVPQMAAKKVLGLGVTLPGEKYIGPGNPLNLGDPNSAGDEAAYQHDLDYDAMLKKGMSEKQVYMNFSNADQRLMKRADVTTPSGLAAYLGMGAKKVFLPKINEDDY